MSKYRVGIIGATGAVGLEMIKTLEESDLPVGELRLYASERSAGKKLSFKGRSIQVEPVTSGTWKDLHLALFSAGSTLSHELAPKIAANGTYVVDNSSAWRMEPNIPLVVPEVNPDELKPGSYIIANPNCSTIQMVVALKPIHDAAKIQRIIVATYQAASGAGGKAMEDLSDQTRAWSDNKEIPKSKKLPAQIAFNVIPQVDVFLDNLYTKEEMKMVSETKKIFNSPSIRVSATCARVPVFRGHSEAIWVETERKLTAVDAKKLLSKALGVILLENDGNGDSYPMPIEAAGKGDVFVGRVREDISCENGLSLWVVSDNLLKGAALNAVQIAQKLHEKGILK